MTTEHCHAHPTAPARTVCRTCRRPLCSVCTVLDDRMRPQCVECIQRRSRRYTRVAVALLVLGALGVTAYLVRAHRGGPAAMGAAEDAGPSEQPYDYGASADKVHRLEGQLGKEPCDRRKIVELCDEMLRAGDSRGTIRRAEAFFQACGDHPRLRWLTYGAHKQLSEWDQASAEATKLIESNPYDADFRAWRGIVYEQKGDLEHAVEDYRQAMVLRPRLSDVAMSLANLYERQGKPCDAILPLSQVVFYHPEARNVGGIRARIDEIGAKPECAWAAGEGRAEIHRRQGEGVILAKVRVNDRETGTFIVDTGATLVVFSRAFADKLRLDTSSAPKLLAQTANGQTTSVVVTVDKVEVQGVSAVRVPAAVVDGLRGADGLLGMSFLTRFDLKQTEAVLEIAARKR